MAFSFECCGVRKVGSRKNGGYTRSVAAAIAVTRGPLNGRFASSGAGITYELPDPWHRVLSPRSSFKRSPSRTILAVPASPWHSCLLASEGLSQKRGLACSSRGAGGTP